MSLWGRAEGVGGMRTSEMKLDIMVEYRSVGKLLACDNFATIFSDVLVGFTFWEGDTGGGEGVKPPKVILLEIRILVWEKR